MEECYMDNFNEKLAAAFGKLGISVVDEGGNKIDEQELTNMLKQSDLERKEKNTIYQAYDNWYLNIHEPYTGNLKQNFIGHICANQKFEHAYLYGINDSFTGAIYILTYRNKKALFTLEEYHGMMGGGYVCYDKTPFIYDELKVYADWTEWDDYGYVVGRIGDKWKLIKVTQFPEPKYEIIGNEYLTQEEALACVGIYDLERYIQEGRTF